MGDPMKLCRLIYKSVATAEVVPNQSLRDIEREAVAANSRAGITGLLMLSGDVFVQVLEGASRDVTALFGKILGDRRHHLVELITVEPTDERYFRDWNMRLLDLYDLPGEKRAVLAAKYQGQDGGIVIPPDVHSIYALLFDARHLCLSTPWQAPGGDDPAHLVRSGSG
jgi:hypothetical protein